MQLRHRTLHGRKECVTVAPNWDDGANVRDFVRVRSDQRVVTSATLGATNFVFRKHLLAL
ncbi:MAG: hypothetical protein DMF45_12965 [Verrucomicrobia bacterium]|nr:MAG: hypothetical protein DMF45_12965 [Verrucomicrobiota bacterium]